MISMHILAGIFGTISRVRWRATIILSRALQMPMTRSGLYGVGPTERG
jgi:hypothetical protein